MATFRKIAPATVEAITFDELVEYGKGVADSFGKDGMPWSFRYHDCPITHENNDCYLICGPVGTRRFERGDMLVTDSGSGQVYPCSLANFNEVFAPVK